MVRGTTHAPVRATQDEVDRAMLALELRAQEIEAERAAAAALEAGEATPEQVDRTLRGLVQRQNPSMMRFEHMDRLVDVGDRILRGELKRVMVFMPPRYLKSEVFSRLLPAAHMRGKPELNVGLSSYGGDLAWSLSESARDYYRADGGLLSRSTAGKKLWATAEGGEMFAAGVGGPLLGFGFHLGVCDDPQDPEAVSSYLRSRRFEKWWPDKWLSRMEPGAALVFVMQRLGPGDAADFLLRREIGDETDEAPEHWHIVICDEVKSDEPLGDWDGPRGLPPTCTVEPDHRKSGMVLAPSRFSAEEVATKQRSAGPLAREAQRQQRPSSPTGDFWDESWFGTYDVLPDFVFDLGDDWDTAYTKDDLNAASAKIRSGRGPTYQNGKGPTFDVYIDDVDWGWWEWPDMLKHIRAGTGPYYIEAKASGKSAKQALANDGLVAKEVAVAGDKLARSSSVQGPVSHGRVLVRRAIRHKLLRGDRQGLLRVRSENLASGKGDLDLNDVFVQALHRHIRPSRRVRRRTRRV